LLHCSTRKLRSNWNTFARPPTELQQKTKEIELMLTRRTKAYSMPMLICNCFHERLADIGKITTFTGIPLFDALVRRFPWT